MRYSIDSYTKAGHLSAKAENNQDTEYRLEIDARIARMFNAETCQADCARAAAAFDDAYMATRRGHS